MKKTLAQWKREVAQVGVKVQMIEYCGGKPAEKISGVRAVKTVQTNSLQFESVFGTGGGSWLVYPKASELEYVGETFTITHEHFVIAGEPIKLVYKVIK